MSTEMLLKLMRKQPLDPLPEPAPPVHTGSVLPHAVARWQAAQAAAEQAALEQVTTPREGFDAPAEKE
ncbi:hypothetical protein ACVNIS_06440 [Sphaerotilaceae bacterium SBD11-9]